MDKALALKQAAEAIETLFNAAKANRALAGTADFLGPRVESGINFLLEGAAAVRTRQARDAAENGGAP